MDTRVRFAGRYGLTSQIRPPRSKISSLTSMNNQKYMDAFDHDVVKRKADFLRKVADVYEASVVVNVSIA